ncbi:MAG TPA: hypothetical protein VF064_21420 [Pyrinomonadaceae bacterium]
MGKEQKLEHLEKVLHSRTLQNSESLKAFLRFVVEKAVDDQEAQLKEYTIATEVFGRDSDYDPRIDSVVRVQAGRLRTKLQEYYAGEGKADEVVIDLPKGHYHPVFNYARAAHTTQEAIHTTSPATSEAATNGHPHAAAPHEHAAVETAPAGLSERTLRLFLVGIIVALCFALLALYYNNRELRQSQTVVDSSPFNAEEFKAVWGLFVSDPEPPLLILSNPAVYRFLNRADPAAATARALHLTPEQVRTTTETPEFREQQLPIDETQPQLLLSVGMYTGMGEAIGLYRLSTLFRSANRDILLRQSRHANAADLKYRNVILLGSVYVNEWSRKLPVSESFNYTNAATIENRLPLAGEEKEYRPQFDERTGELRTDYALITVKPNVSGDHAVMTLAGLYSEGTEAAAEFITTKNHLAVLAQRLKDAGGQGAPPKYYQALLKVGVENGTPTTITLVALRPIG